jgi:hypothetical protein
MRPWLHTATVTLGLFAGLAGTASAGSVESKDGLDVDISDQTRAVDVELQIPEQFNYQARVAGPQTNPFPTTDEHCTSGVVGTRFSATCDRIFAASPPPFEGAPLPPARNALRVAAQRRRPVLQRAQ